MQKENEYGRIIAYERKRANLSVEQLCEGICSPSYLQRIEKGERSCENQGMKEYTVKEMKV